MRSRFDLNRYVNRERESGGGNERESLVEGSDQLKDRTVRECHFNQEECHCHHMLANYHHDQSHSLKTRSLIELELKSFY